jgi:hypothetical protein
MCLLNFYTTQILTSTFCIIECISQLIKVTDCNNARWKHEITHLSLPFLFLPVSGWLMNIGLIFSLTMWKSKYLYTLPEMLCFYDLQKPEMFGILSWMLWDTGTELFKTHKTESVLGKWDQMWYLYKKESAVCSCLVINQNRPRDQPVVVVMKYNTTPQYFT